MRPKSEDEASDYLLHRLRDSMSRVIVNREVQVRRNSRSGIPERSDLLIETVTPSEEPRLRVVIETKGAWSKEILTAIDSQLTGRYLTDLKPAVGIYLVLWPDVDSWAEGQGQQDRNRLRALDRATVQEELSRQATAAVAQGYQIKVEHLDISYRRPSA
jgi:hypothetical protein